MEPGGTHIKKNKGGLRKFKKESLRDIKILQFGRGFRFLSSLTDTNSKRHIDLPSFLFLFNTLIIKDTTKAPAVNL